MNKHIKNSKPLCIIASFYENPQLVNPFFDALFKQQQEFIELNARLCIINDSPKNQILSKELHKTLDLPWQIPIDYHVNIQNIGYLKSVNFALQTCKEYGEDALLINSDAFLFPGALHEIVAVAYSDPMIGFVSPRSNNATLCTFPHDALQSKQSPAKAYERFQKASKHLPRYTYTPTAVGFCLLIRHSILHEFGVFDEIYGLGYNEENDLIMRANRFGYRAVLANHAYAWHDAEQSFSGLQGGRKQRETCNAQILHARYPEYPHLIEQYFNSPSYIAEGLVGNLYPTKQENFAIAIDCPQMGCYHNGTMRLIKEMICAFDRYWPSHCNINIFMSQQAWEFHGLIENDRLRRFNLNEFSTACAAVIRIGQPFSSEELKRIWIRAPIVGIMMLDTIAWDCGYLQTGWDESVWSFALEYVDLIYTNSQFTHSQLLKRFDLGAHTTAISILHSTSINDYKTNNLFDKTILSQDVCKPRVEEVLEQVITKNPLLIVGNHFHHKDVERTATLLANQLPTIDIAVLTQAGDFPKNVHIIPTGYLHEHQLNNLYNSAQAIIFPSHYEGFGFPVLHALAHGKPIFLRELPPYREIQKHLHEGSDNLHYFLDLEDLAQQLRNGIPQWQGGPAKSSQFSWRDTAQTILESIEEKRSSIQSKCIAQRLRLLKISSGSARNSTAEENSLTKHLYERIHGLEAQIALINNTWSWKLTIGLRWIRRYLGIMKRKLRANHH